MEIRLAVTALHFSPLSAILLLMGAWGVIALAAMVRPANLEFPSRVLFPLGAACALAIAVLASYSLMLPAEERTGLLSAFRTCRCICAATRSAASSSPAGGAAAGVSIYGAGYFRHHQGTAPGVVCFNYHLFLASMAGLLLANAYTASWSRGKRWRSAPTSSGRLGSPHRGDPPRGPAVSGHRACRRHRVAAVLRSPARRHLGVHLRRHARHPADAVVGRPRIPRSRCSASAPRPASCRCTSGCPRRIPPRRRRCRR